MPGVTRRVVRLLVLLGIVGAAYFVLSLFDHAAWADPGFTDPVAPVKAVADGAGTVFPEAKTIISKPTAPKADPQRHHRPTIKAPEARPPKAQAPKKSHASTIQEPRKIKAPSIRAGETGRRVQARTSKRVRSTSDVVRGAGRATSAPARTAVLRQTVSTPAKLPSRPGRAALPDLPQAGLPALPQQPSLPQLVSWPQRLGLPQAQLSAWPELSAWPGPPSWTQRPVLPQARLSASPQLSGFPLARTPALIGTAALPSALVPHQSPVSPVSAQEFPRPPAFAPAPELSGLTKPPTAQAQPRTAPLPAPPRQPADRSTSTGQTRDSGGGNTPAVGPVSSWRPEPAAAGRRLASDLIARGRTVCYAAPPS